MPPANNQLFSFNDVVAEVAAGRMLWTGAAQSGTSPISWLQFTTYVSNDGTNPVGYAANQCPAYLDCLNRAVVINPPTGLSATNFGLHTAEATWTAPSTGLAPTSYTIRWYRAGVLKQTITGNPGTSATSSTGSVSYNTGDSVGVDVMSVNGALQSSVVGFTFTF